MNLYKVPPETIVTYPNSNPSRRHWLCSHPASSRPLTHACGVRLWELKLQSPGNTTVKVTSVQGYRCKMACDSLLVWGSEDPYLCWLLGTLCSCHSWQQSWCLIFPTLLGRGSFPRSHFCRSQMTALTVCTIRWNFPVVACRMCLSDTPTPRMFSQRGETGTLYCLLG